MAAALPGSVLFACTLNRVRSPIAAGLMRRRFGQVVFVDSCGLRYDPQAGEPDPFVAAVMDEAGIDLAGHAPKTFADLDETAFDLVVSLTPEAQHRAVELGRRHAVELEYWPTADPTLAAGSREQILEAYRHTRDELEARISSRFRHPRSFGG